MASLIGRLGIGFMLFTGRLEAQSFLWQLDGDPSTTAEFGYRVLCVGDLDGDGCDDFVVSDPEYKSTGLSPNGAFYVYSGKSRSLLWSAIGTEALAYMGQSLARLSDIDGDGFDEFAVTSHTNHVDVYSSKAGTVLYSIPTNMDWRGPVANAGDLDLDGVDDVLIGISGSQGRDAFAYSGMTGALLYAWPDARGQSVCSVGDVNGDGQPDVLIGDPNDGRGGFFNGGVFLYSGADGSLLREIDGQGDGSFFGSPARGGHDLDGDGVPDFVVGGKFFGGPNCVFAYSGATGTEITKWLLNAGVLPDRYVEFAGDVDDDGMTDLLINDGVDVELISGRTWSDLFRITNLEGSLTVGDVDGDGIVDVLVGAEQTKPTGAVFAYSAAIPPQVTGVQPERGDHRATTSVVVSGAMFTLGSNLQVLFGGTPASNVVVVDHATITCDAPPGAPGPTTVTVQNSIGSGSLDGGFVYTPAVTWDGDASPGGLVNVHYLCDPFDGVFAIVGSVGANIPTPPFGGVLGIAPFYVMFALPPKVWPFGQLDVSGNVPDDPSLIGATVLFQALDGPSFASPKVATWTNVATMTIK